MKSILISVALCFCPCLGSLAAQTLTLNNTANSGLNDPEIGADFVAGDTFSLVITGAAPNAAVTLLEWQNDVPLNGGQQWTAGRTDANGNFTIYGRQTANYIATYLEVWFVNGVEIHKDLEFAVIPVPTSLSVASASLAAWPDLCTQRGLNYGIAIDVKYNILSPTGTNVATTYVNMTPYEDVKYYVNGVYDPPDKHSNIGPVTQYSDSTLYAAEDGTFHDVPVSTCANFSFSNDSQIQEISVMIGNNFYQVRQQTWVMTGPSSGHGSITNNTDVNLTR